MNKQPWITKGIIKSISTRNKLYKEALRSNCDQKRKEYKNIETILQRLFDYPESYITLKNVNQIRIT